MIVLVKLFRDDGSLKPLRLIDRQVTSIGTIRVALGPAVMAAPIGSCTISASIASSASRERPAECSGNWMSSLGSVVD